MLIQIILIFFALYALTRVVARYKKEQTPIGELLLWFMIWFGVIFVALFPDFADLLAHVVGVGRGADMIVYLSLSVLFYLVFKIVGRLYRMERDITKLVRHVAIREVTTDQEKKT